MKFLIITSAFVFVQFSLKSQCLSGDCNTGLGEKKYQDSSRFVGQFVNGAKTQGTYIYPNGDFYMGSFEKNLRKGVGTYQYKNGNVFHGEYDNDEKYYGTLLFRNGDKYSGSWENNKPSGMGTYVYANGKIWEGIWENGKKMWGISRIDSLVMEGSEVLPVDSLLEEKALEVNEKSFGRPRVFAVIVGIADYQGTGSDLTYADDDARLFCSQLKKAMPLETTAGDVRLLTNDDATQQKVTNALQEVFGKSGDNDFIIFFFSGHGAPGYFCPSDIYTGKLHHSAIKSYFKSSKAAYRLCIADACFSGSIGSSGNQQTSSSAANSMRDAKLAVIMSSRPDQTSSENSNLRQGLFTYYMNAGIRGMADFNNDSYVTAGELFLYTRSKVSEQSKGAQIPVIFGKNLNRIPLSRVKN